MRDRRRGFLAKIGSEPRVTGDPPAATFEDAEGDEDSFDALLRAVEGTALAIYAACGLPTAAGHYARNPQGGAWKFVAESLTPEERFALMQANPPERGWRFGRLADLGRLSADPTVVLAGTLLAEVAHIRTVGRAGATSGDLMRAVRLGELWRQARDVEDAAFSGELGGAAAEQT